MLSGPNRDGLTNLSSEKSYQGICIAIDRQPAILIKQLKFDDDENSTLRMIHSSKCSDLAAMTIDLKQSLSSIRNTRNGT